jgi:hypothetical protein
MRMFGRKTGAGKRSQRRVVVTGKRLKGTWVMESALSPRAKANRSVISNLPTENRRVRTLH